VKSSAEEETPKEVLASLAEQRHMRRQKSRADKAQIRHNKEQNKLEQEQEQKKLQFLKRVEKEYKVSFQGLFPR
jgi:argininosuccinate lyase